MDPPVDRSALFSGRLGTLAVVLFIVFFPIVAVSDGPPHYLAMNGIVIGVPAVGSLWYAIRAIPPLWAGRGRIRGLGSLSLGVVMSAFALCVLASMTLSTNYKRPGQISRSMSNIRQLGLAATQYEQDYDGAFPGWRSDGTRAHPRYVHNVWDSQVASYLGDPGVFSNGSRGVRSPSDRSRARVLTYALNGCLIAGWKDGNAMWGKGPQVVTVDSLSNSANTVLFAEVATDAPMGGRYAHPGVRNDSKAKPNTAYAEALTQWIDIDPRAWVETKFGDKRDYYEGAWDVSRGVGRDLYGGGASYAFCDGHVRFQKILRTTTSGQTDFSPDKNWSAGSPRIQFNQWYPG